MQAIVIGTFLVMSITLLVASIYLPKRNCQQQAREWVRAVEKADDDETIIAQGPLQIATNINQRHLSDAKREQRAKAKFNAARVRQRTAQLANNYHTALEPGAKALVCLAALDGSTVDTKAIAGVPTDEFGQLFEKLLADTVTDARGGSIVAIHDYLLIMRDPHLRQFCEQYGIDLPVDPDDWDDIVLQRFHQPTLDNLRNTRGHTPAEVLQMARTAVNDNDASTAKRVVAYCLEKGCEHNVAGDGNPTVECACSDTYPFHDFIGDDLWSKLNIMIAATTRTS